MKEPMSNPAWYHIHIIYLLIGLWIILVVAHLGIEKEHEQFLKNQEKIMAAIKAAHPHYKEVREHLITK